MNILRRFRAAIARRWRALMNWKPCPAPDCTLRNPCEACRADSNVW